MMSLKIAFKLVKKYGLDVSIITSSMQSQFLEKILMNTN